MKTEKWFLRFLPIFLFCFVLSSLSLVHGKVPVDNKSAEGLYSIGLSYSKVGNYAEALPYFEKAVKKNPNYADGYSQIGYCNQKLGYYTKAVEAYKQAIRINPDDADTRYNLGLINYKFNRYTEASEAYKQAIRVKPEFAEAYNNLGMAYDKLAWRTEAIESFKQAIRIKPDYAEAYNNLGFDYDNLSRHTEAIESFKQAISVNPNYAEAYYNMGWTYEKLGNYTEASEAYKQAIHINPGYTTMAQNHIEQIIHYTETSELPQKNESPQVTAVERIGDAEIAQVAQPVPVKKVGKIEIAQVAQQKEVSGFQDKDKIKNPRLLEEPKTKNQTPEQVISINPDSTEAQNNSNLDMVWFIVIACVIVLLVFAGNLAWYQEKGCKIDFWVVVKSLGRALLQIAAVLTVIFLIIAFISCLIDQEEQKKKKKEKEKEAILKEYVKGTAKR